MSPSARPPTRPPRAPESVTGPVPGDRPATIALLQSHSLTQLVQAEIEGLILNGELAPGEKLTELTLAARLGVSRGPIREAFRLLEEAGLVRTEKNRGVFVRQVPLVEALEIFDLRAVMDEWVGRRLALTADAAQIKELRVQVEAMERAVKEEDATTYHRLNLKFHDRMVEMTGNAKLTATYRRLIKELSLFRRLNLATGRLLPQSAQEHRHILKAIAAQDSEAAGSAMYKHVMESRQRTIDNHLAEDDTKARDSRKAPRDPRQRQKV